MACLAELPSDEKALSMALVKILSNAIGFFANPCIPLSDSLRSLR